VNQDFNLIFLMKLIKINNQENKFNQVKIVVQTMMQNVLNGEVSDTTGDAMKRLCQYTKKSRCFYNGIILLS
jgi:hypothetical protein